jgi:hypothetical protein
MITQQVLAPSLQVGTAALEPPLVLYTRAWQWIHFWSRGSCPASPDTPSTAVLLRSCCVHAHGSVSNTFAWPRRCDRRTFFSHKHLWTHTYAMTLPHLSQQKMSVSWVAGAAADPSHPQLLTAASTRSMLSAHCAVLIHIALPLLLLSRGWTAGTPPEHSTKQTYCTVTRSSCRVLACPCLEAGSAAPSAAAADVVLL